MLDFLNLVELFESHGVTFVSVTQSFNTKDAMGRMALNILVTFAQFERELIGERIRDKVAASRKRGKWMGVGRRWAMRSVTASCWSTRPMPNESELYFGGSCSSNPPPDWLASWAQQTNAPGTAIS
jgi:hypothetical protein